MEVAYYRVTRHIATGGFAEVHQAIDSRNGNVVALKIINKFREGDPTHMEDIRAEVDIFRSLDHPYICKFIEVFEFGEQVVISMEYLEGGTLLDYANEKEDLSETEILGYFSQLMSAIAYMHMNHVCHRDLRLDNLCFDARHNLKVIDFGLSYSFDPSFPVMDLPCGCPAYAAPEIISADNYSPLVDIWSAGVVLYTLAVGRLPFDGTTAEEVLSSMVQSDPVYPDFLSDPLIDLLQHILVKDPTIRYTIADIQNHPWMASQRASQSHQPTRVTPRPREQRSGASESPPLSWWQRMKQRFKRKGKKRDKKHNQ